MKVIDLAVFALVGVEWEGTRLMCAFHMCVWKAAHGSHVCVRWLMTFVSVPLLFLWLVLIWSLLCMVLDYSIGPDCSEGKTCWILCLAPCLGTLMNVPNPAEISKLMYILWIGYMVCPENRLEWAVEKDECVHPFLPPCSVQQSDRSHPNQLLVSPGLVLYL
jgi:hypothetical protein